MVKYIDDFLNGITMYRLMLYVLIALVAAATALSLWGVLPFKPIPLLLSTVFLTAVCWAANTILAKVFKAQTNLESVYITALILTLIITPVNFLSDIPILGAVAILAMASKYFLALNRKHIFNPAAFTVALGALIFNTGGGSSFGGASWWVGTPSMTPLVIVGGLLIVRKIRRFSLVISYFISALVMISGFSMFEGSNIAILFKNLILNTPILFFAFVMLTEPQTTPPGKFLQIAYGSLVGLLFAPFIRLDFFSFTPETALLAGNIFSYLVSPKEKLLLRLKEKIQQSPDIYDLVFDSDKKLTYLAGQYMEWTLSHSNPDSRGSRRFFTIASSPTEGNLRIGVRFNPDGSSFKKTLISLEKGDKIVASQLAGDFTLPKVKDKKLVFLAGGIGITPYRSMIKYLLDTKQKRDIILFYANKLASGIVYKDIFDEAWQNLGIKTVYVVTDKVGYINEEMIKAEVPDFKDRIFYISGPHSMVDVFEKVLKEMGISKEQIKIDFFPGYA